MGTAFTYQSLSKYSNTNGFIKAVRKPKKLKFTGLLPAQKAFARAIDQPFSAIVGGYGSGKTRALVPRYCNLSVKRGGKVRMLIVAPSYSMLEDIDEPLFITWLEKNGIKYTHQKKRHIITIEEYFKGEVWFRSGDNPSRLVGFEVTDFCIDEYDTLKFDHQKEVWERCIARARMGPEPTGGVVTTPEGFRYTYKLFVEKEVGKLIKAKTTDNFYLPPDYITNLRSQYDAELIEQYLNGEFVLRSGKHAYYFYSKDNLYTHKQSFNDDTILIGMDFNVDPMTAVACYYKYGVLYAFDEFFLKNSSTEEMIAEIRKRYPLREIMIAPDFTGKGRHSSAVKGITNLILLEQQIGFSIIGDGQAGNPFVRDRINCMNSALNKGLLFVDKSLDYLKKDLMLLQTNEKGEIIKDDPMMEHISTALGYLVWWVLSPRIYGRNISVGQG